jgi:hypothetical protein
MKEDSPGAEPSEKPRCPICGEPGGYLWTKTVNGRQYHYWVHSYRVDGKRKARYCYLGPDAYEHAAKFNPIGLAGALEKERFMKYARLLLGRLSEDQKRWLFEALSREVGPKRRGLLGSLGRRREAHGGENGGAP